MRRAALVYNPFAGKRRSGDLADAIGHELAGLGFEVEPVPTRSAGDAIARARDAADQGFEVLFSLGGDGTLRECAAGLLDSDTALAFLPAGTVNVMALELGLPALASAAVRSYRNSEIRPFDVGFAGGEIFLMQFSAGIDARLIAELRPSEKKLLGKFSSVPAALRSLARYSFPVFELETENGLERATLVVASNIRHYGGRWQLTPTARADNGLLDLVIFTGSGRFATIRFALSLVVGRHLRSPKCKIHRIEHALLRTTPGLACQIDGDAYPGADKIELSIASERLRMLVPKAQGT